jgi:hypothetical protein
MPLAGARRMMKIPSDGGEGAVAPGVGLNPKSVALNPPRWTCGHEALSKLHPLQGRGFSREPFMPLGGTIEDENVGGSSSTRPERRTKTIGLTEFGPPKTPFSEEFGSIALLTEVFGFSLFVQHFGDCHTDELHYLRRVSGVNGHPKAVMQ